jgi:hypothetical protein
MAEVDLSAAVQRIRTRVDYGDRKRMLAVAVPLEDLKAVLAWFDEFLAVDLTLEPPAPRAASEARRL